MTDDDVERSESGQRILRHKPRETPFTAPAAHGAHCEEIEAHLEKHVGKVESVFHELISDIIHLDVLWVKATAQRPYHLLVTSGVSDLAMTVPAGQEEFNRAELMMALPASWPLEGDTTNDETNYWPIRWLKFVGRLPHEYQTWIGNGHTIPNGDPPEPIAGTAFAGVMLMAQYALPNDFFQLATRAGDKVSFYALVPLYAEEMDLKLRKGASEIAARFAKQKIDFVLDIDRPNVALKRGWLKW
jgi:hypothetical protein